MMVGYKEHQQRQKTITTHHMIIPPSTRYPSPPYIYIYIVVKLIIGSEATSFVLIFLTFHSFPAQFSVQFRSNVAMDYKRHPVINGKYKITGRIGSGSFGEIFMGIGISGERVALKIEKVATKHPQLRHEYKVYRHLFNAYGFATVR